MPDNPIAAELLAKIKAHDALVGIIGMGYVGLPLALAFVEKGFPVLGFDVDPEKVAKLNRGEGYIKHLDGGRIAAAVATGRFTATADFSRLGEADAVLICVPTPLAPQREPDMTYVDAAAHQVRATLRPVQLVILESTTYPGTTDERLRALLEFSMPASIILRAGLHGRDHCHPEHRRSCNLGENKDNLEAPLYATFEQNGHARASKASKRTAVAEPACKI